MDPSTLVTLGLLAALAYRLLLKPRYYSRLPPGPKPLPIIGNILDVPKERAWLKYMEWKKRYGDIVYTNMLGKPVVILNSLKACNDLLDQRSAIYSDRPRAVMVTEVVGWDFNFALFGYNSRWRRHRRLFRQHFSSASCHAHHPAQEHAVHDLLRRLLNEPKEFLTHIRFSLSKVMMEVVYDIKATEPNNPYVINAERVTDEVFASIRPGQFLVDLLPVLKYVPSWMPGAGFKRTAREWNSLVLDTQNLPFNQVKENNKRGTAGPSIVSSLLSQYEGSLEKCEDGGFDGETMEQSIKGSMALAHAAASDTTATTLKSFFLAMANHPEVQRSAQEELDSVVGESRLPTFEDIHSLPYITAIIKEILRCYTTAPLGVPHVVTQDDEYEGYLIPKWSIILPNIWAIYHDQETYPDPYSFKPSRWLTETEQGRQINPDVQDISSVFGFGRRICPGMYFAQDNLFLTISSTLACFHISPLDIDGKPANSIKEEFSDGLTMAPAPFKVALTPRSERAVELIQETALGDV